MKQSQNIKSKMMSKKRLLAPICLVLMATMILVPVTAKVTYTWLSGVDNSSNVTNPQNIVGTSADGAYAKFNPTNAMLIGPMRTSPSSSVTPGLYGYASGSVTIDMYMTNNPYGTWAYAGSAIASATTKMYFASGSAYGSNGGFSTYGSGTFYADYAEFKY